MLAQFCLLCGGLCIGHTLHFGCIDSAQESRIDAPAYSSQAEQAPPQIRAVGQSVHDAEYEGGQLIRRKADDNDEQYKECTH